MYPPRCPICEDIIKDKPVCEKCKKSLNYVGSVRCLKCGKAITDDEREYCGDCQKRKHLFESGVAVFQYDERNFDQAGEIYYVDESEKYFCEGRFLREEFEKGYQLLI